MVHRLNQMEIDQFLKDAVEAAIKARGWCIGGYAQVEFIMADFAVKVGRLAGYEDLATPFPMNFATRLKRVRSIADRQGVLSPYAEPLRSLADAIESWEQQRHFFTHGWMDVLVSRPSDTITFRLRRFTPTKADDAAVTLMDFTLADIESAGTQLANLADMALKLFDDIYAEHGLESSARSDQPEATRPRSEREPRG